MIDSSCNLAVVDDEAHMRKALVRLLSSHGCRVESYAGGFELLAALQVIPHDCIVLDLHMPDLNGFDLLAVMQSRGLRVPVVAITGNDEAGLEQRVRALGASSILLKPVDQSALLSAIKEAIHAHSMLPPIGSVNQREQP